MMFMIRVSLYLWAMIFCVMIVVTRLSSPIVKIMFNPETDGPIMIERKHDWIMPRTGAAELTCATTITTNGGASGQVVLVPCVNGIPTVMWGFARDAWSTIPQHKENQ
jgi:hypothetical protein